MGVCHGYPYIALYRVPALTALMHHPRLPQSGVPYAAALDPRLRFTTSQPHLAY